MKNWEKLGSELVFDSRFIKIKKDIVKIENNKIIDWFYWDTNDSAMVIGMLPNKKLVMIKQYRYLARKEVIEFPSGSLHENESPKKGAIREFEEETGYAIKSLAKLGSFFETYGNLNRKIHIFFSNDLKKSVQKLDSGIDEFENIKVMPIDYDKAIDLAIKNKILAMGSSLAILLLDKNIKNGKIKI
ncbi:MAG: NUDIX hydrolase [Candidatus Nanoarchaeia archaeon]|nr:NUDIX hydrolase [Candidatus Nanoarchaeia archaeon]